MGNVLSANALFHFTKSIDNLLDIIQNGFLPRCCCESLEFIDDLSMVDSSYITIAIPMVCFCDIPLSQTGTHRRNYGAYAIGLSKEWGESKGINPVLYELPGSNAVNIIKECLGKTLSYSSKELSKTSRELNEIGSEIFFFLSYIKPYEGKKWDGKSFNGEKIKFYDEREWRYIPDYNEIHKDNLRPYMFIDEYLDKNKREAFDKSLEAGFQLKFGPDDLKYIIVDRESDVIEMMDRISKIDKNYSERDKKLLITKIISLERIEQDF